MNHFSSSSIGASILATASILTVPSNSSAMTSPTPSVGHSQDVSSYQNQADAAIKQSSMGINSSLNLQVASSTSDRIVPQGIIPSYNTSLAYPPELDIQVDTRKKLIAVLKPDDFRNVVNNFPLVRANPVDFTYKPVRSISFAVSDNVRFLIGNSRMPVQVGLVVTLENNQNRLTQLGVGYRKNVPGVGVFWQTRF